MRLKPYSSYRITEDWEDTYSKLSAAQSGASYWQKENTSSRHSEKSVAEIADNQA